MKRPWFKVCFGVLIFIVVFAALQIADIDFSNMSVETFKQNIDSLGIWGPVAYVIFYLIRPLILFPAGVLSASAGVIWSLGKGFFILQIAANISSTVEFVVARYFMRDAVEKLIKGKVASLDEKIEKNGFLTVLLIRLIPNVAWDIQNLGLGLTKVKFRDYFIATLVGIMPGAFAFVFFGSSMIAVVTNPKNWWMVVLAAFVFWGIYKLQAYLKNKNFTDNNA